MMMSRSILAMLFMLFTAAIPASADVSRAELEVALEGAGASFEKATSILQTDPAGARALLDESVATFEKIMREGGVANGGLYYNIGNAHMLRGDIGRAVLNYRRAQALTPGDVNLAANLAAARQRVTPRIPPSTDGRVLRTVLFWHYDFTAQSRFGAFAFAFGAFWLIALLRLVDFLPRWSWWGAALLALIAASAISSLRVEQADRREARGAVVVAQQLVGRKGPDAAGYEPSFTEPLGAGVELRIIERRPGWALVRLADGRETWVLQSAIEAI